MLSNLARRWQDEERLKDLFRPDESPAGWTHLISLAFRNDQCPPPRTVDAQTCVRPVLAHNTPPFPPPSSTGVLHAFPFSALHSQGVTSIRHTENVS